MDNKNRLYIKLTDFLKSTDGQSMVEFCVGVPVLLFMLCAIIFVTDVYIIKEKAQVSARYGAWRLAQDVSSNSFDTVESNILSTNFKHYDKDKIKIKDVSGQVHGENDSGVINKIFTAIENSVDQIIDFAGDVMTGEDSQARKGVEVTYKKPFIIAFHNTDDPGKALSISSRHVVSTNCWDGANTDVNEPIEGLWNAGMELVKGIVNGFSDNKDGLKESKDESDKADKDTDTAETDDISEL